MKRKVRRITRWAKICKKYIVKFLIKIRTPFLILLITFTLIFSVFRALTPFAKKYKVDIEQHLTQLLGQPVHIEALETNWYWFHPVLKMKQITVMDADHHVLQVNKLLIGINIFRSIWTWKIQPGILYVEDVHVTLHQLNHSWDVDGLRSMTPAISTKPSTYQTIIIGLLAEEKIIVKNVSADFYFNDHTHLAISDFAFKAVRSYGHFRLNGHAKIVKPTVTDCSIIADLLIPERLENLGGSLYLDIHHFAPTQWQKLFPKIPYDILSGSGDLALWIDILQGKVKSIQSSVHVENASWRDNNLIRKMQIFQANIAWRKTAKGWRWSADKIRLVLEGVSWPINNSLLIDYKKSQNQYSLYVKEILLDPLLSLDVSWPEKLASLRSIHPQGVLHDTQIIFQDNQVNLLLTRFEGLGWQVKNQIPAIKNLSGVIYWQPNEGRLELDSEQTIIAPLNLSPLTFKFINAALDWKTLNNDVRIQLDRLVLSHPMLLLNAQGVLDQPYSDAAGNLRLTAEFYAKNAAPLLAYIPAELLKPKLDNWLKQSITRVDQVSGQILVNGKLAEFPFDKAPGEFMIKSQLKGVDLLIGPDWPVNRDINAELIVDKRGLAADIDHGFLQDVAVDRVNLAINDIGLGEESLLIHGRISALAHDMKKYLFASPLRQRFFKLKRLLIKEPIALDLSLDIPLYPERNIVLARGDLNFAKNQAVVEGFLEPVKIDRVNGGLQFNENGITSGNLTGTLNEAPITLHAASFKLPKPYTAINIDGDTSMERLNHLMQIPLGQTMHGPVHLSSSFKVFESSEEPDQLQINSSLQGVTIDLPVPMEKSATDLRPFSLQALFYPDQCIDLQVNYADTWQTSLIFESNDKQGLILKKGTLKFGKGALDLPKKSGLIVLGTVPELNIDKWQNALALNWKKTSSLPTASLSADVKVDKLTLFSQIYPQVAFKANQVSSDDWSFAIDQIKLNARLHYKPSMHLLSGELDRLWLESIDMHKSSVESKSSPLYPTDLPSINVTVKDFKLGEVQVGELVLKGTQTHNNWSLDEGKITTPEYTLNIKGDWTRNDHVNKTAMQMNLHIQDLGKSLERWSIKPAVMAKDGTVTFQGGWNRGLMDFSLDQCTGNMDIILKNGRISHFDKETESKLGLGKLLSILSLQTIPRRLQLDFSDLSEEGYSFDVFKGHFDIQHGVMNTKDSYIDGPVAYASMSGDLDLSHRLYDIDLRITPYITASLPIVATIAGGPVAGIATWVASKIINKGMQQISGYTYKITGPWLDPVVTQVTIIRKKTKNQE